MEDNKKNNTDRQKAKELTEKLEEGMAGLRSSMETMRRNVEDFISGMEYAIRRLQEEWEAESDKAVDRQKEDEPEKTYQEVEVFGVPALFDNARILPEDVPEGLLLYDLRGSDDDPGDPVTMERHVLVNHAASILTAVPLPVPEQGALWLGEELNFVGGMITVREFMEGHSGIDMDSLMENMENAICHENEELFLKPSVEYGRYAIYQINEDAVKENYLFMNLELVKSKGIEVRGEDYSLVYGGKLPENVTLEMLFEKFNISRPEGFRGHSLSVSDVVVTNRGGEVNAYYVDSFGYAELPEFVKQRQNLPEPKIEEQLEEYPAVYKHSAEYASEHWEEELFMISHNLNVKCKKAIEAAVNENFDGLRLNPDAVMSVMEEYGAERMAYVLSATLQWKTWDERFSKSNKEWAAQTYIPETMAMGRNLSRDMEVNSHPVVLDGFVDLFREELRERGKDAGLETEQNDAEQIGMGEPEQASAELEPEQNETEQSGVSGPGQTAAELEDEDELIDLGDEREKVLAEMKGILESGGEPAGDFMESAENEGQTGETARKEKDDDAVSHFKTKTEELFHSISDMNPSEIEETVKCHVQAKIDESGMEAAIVDVAVTGSRCRGLEKNGSDLDVVVELSTDEREDDLFALFNEDGLHIGEVTVDINPITAQRTGTLETYLPQAEEYLEELRRARENEPVSLFNIRMNDEERWFKNTSGLDAEGRCKAYAECGRPFVEMGKYGERIEAADHAYIEQGDKLDFSIEFNDETGRITIFDGTDFISKGMRETLFLQRMEDEPDAVVELAVKIDCLTYDHDTALYHRSVEGMEENVSEIAGAIRQGDTGHLTAWLADILTGNAAMEEMERAAELLQELNDYKPLAKIEEMEEQNCNMIDNVPNNGAGEKAQKEEIPSGHTMMPCGADKENKELQETPAGRVSLKERLAQKQAIVSGKGNEPQEGREKGHREM